MTTRATSIVLFVIIGFAASAMAQFAPTQPGDAELGESRIQKWRAGMVIRAVGGPCRGLVGTVPVPIDWPEQRVQIVDEEVTSNAQVDYRMVDGTVKQMVVAVRQLPTGEEAKAVVTFEIERHTQQPPDNTAQYRVPESRELDSSMRAYLGPSPLIESNDRRIRKLAHEIGADAPTAWQRVEAIYDWVRDKVEYKNGPLKGAVAALNDGTGDCEELTSLFIAICRAADIPARTVWVPGHCYPEFYLMDEQGEGHWFPCQAAGSREFGGITELRPILQKGDNFRPPHNRRDRQRYLAEHLTGAGGRPQVRFVREAVQ